MQKRSLIVFLLWPMLAGAAQLPPLNPTITYQGRLVDGGKVANGKYDLRFRLMDAVTNGNQVGFTLTNAPVPASNGLFTVAVNFGAGVFDGSSRWLEIGVRSN